MRTILLSLCLLLSACNLPQATVERLDPVTAASDLLIPLGHTEGKSFMLSGEVWLDGPSTTGSAEGNAPDGFSLYLRVADDRHRYEFNSSFIRNKRRLGGGVLASNIVWLADLPPATLHAWIPFSITVTRDKITYRFGKTTRVADGPLDIDGRNEIFLVAGSRLRNVQWQILPD